MKLPTHALVALLSCAAATSAISAPKPNVLLICVDDLKPTLGCYGDPIARTPNIDALSERSVLFEAAYCNQAVCAPSRNALMTGLRPDTIGIYDLGTNFRKSVPDAITVAQQFRAAGYRTEAIGKILHRGHGNTEDSSSWSVPHMTPKASTYVVPASTASPAKDRFGKNRGTPTERSETEDDTYADGKIAREAVKRLQTAAESPEEPFFLAVGFVRPHLPFVAPAKYWDMYDPESIPMPEVSTPPAGAPDYAPQFGGELRQYSGMPKKGELSDETTRHLIHGYYAATSYMDAQLGLVVDALDANGFADNTIIVLWGDHGWHLGDHGMWCKHTNYEQAARIPVIIAAPGRSTGENTNAFLETVDLYPTLCELAKIPVPDGLDGRSQVAVLDDPTASVREHVLHVYPRGGRLGRAIRNDRYRLVEWKRPGDPAEWGVDYELYDYEKDPLETENLAGIKTDVVSSMSKTLEEYSEAKTQLVVLTPEQEKKATEARQKRVDAFAKRDADKDGFLTVEEFLSRQPDPEEAPKRFPRFDRNGDGQLTEEEYVRGGN